jgi:DnaJ-class molecular chaperone
MSTKYLVGSRTKCGGAHCEATIVWGELNGRAHPYDEIPCKNCAGAGRPQVVTRGFFEEGKPGDSMPCGRCKGRGFTLRSHFESCVDAATFRKAAKP